MPAATLTTKGQLVVPKEIRESMHLHPGDKLDFVVKDNGEVVVNFGRNAGKKLRDMVAGDTGFLKWILNKDFPLDVQDLVRNALNGVFPSPPEKGNDD